MQKKFKEYLILFLTGMFIYTTMEVWFRGYSYRLMSIIGGLCFLLIATFKEIFTWDTPILIQMLYGSILITMLEAITGNLTLQLFGIRMWDYSNMWMSGFNNFTCPLFSFIWFLLSFVAIILSDSMKYYWLHDGSQPYYILFGKKYTLPKRECILESFTHN